MTDGIECGLPLAELYLDFVAEDPAFSVRVFGRRMTDGTTSLVFADGEEFRIHQWDRMSEAEVGAAVQFWIAKQVHRLGINARPLA
jgi:hypothetical protein